MATQITDLDIYQWLPTDPFDVAQVNHNFKQLAEHIDLKSSEDATNSEQVSWHVRKYNDGSVELYCRLSRALICSQIVGVLYSSPVATVAFPTNAVTAIKNVQITAYSANNELWCVNHTSPTSTSSVSFKVISPTENAASSYIDILVKGV